jgi:hypothetical protein
LKEKVAVATVDGKAYFLIVNQLREHKIPFVSVIPGEPMPPQVKAAITTEKERDLVSSEQVLIFHDENELDSIVSELKRILLGKEAYERVVIGIDPGEAIGLAEIADGKVIEETNCFTKQELVNCVLKLVENLSFQRTSVAVKMGNGVPVYRELLEALDEALPPAVTLEVVSEAGTNKPQKRRSRGVRHISSAIRIAARSGRIVSRRCTIAANNPTQ